jgi:hypothetical protein
MASTGAMRLAGRVMPCHKSSTAARARRLREAASHLKQPSATRPRCSARDSSSQHSASGRSPLSSKTARRLASSGQQVVRITPAAKTQTWRGASGRKWARGSGRPRGARRVTRDAPALGARRLGAARRLPQLKRAGHGPHPHLLRRKHVHVVPVRVGHRRERLQRPCSRHHERRAAGGPGGGPAAAAAEASSAELQGDPIEWVKAGFRRMGRLGVALHRGESLGGRAGREGPKRVGEHVSSAATCANRWCTSCNTAAGILARG